MLAYKKTMFSYFRQENDQQDGKMARIKSFCRENRLLIFIILAVALGLLVGLLINKPVQELKQPAKGNVLLLVGFPGEIFMRLLKMLSLPLIMTSLIIGFADLDLTSSLKLTKRALMYYLCTTCISALIGLLLTVSIKPGNHGDDKKFNNDINQFKTRLLDTILDHIRNMFPENIVQACIEQAATRAEEIILRTDTYNSTYNATITKKTVLISGKTSYKSGTNILGVVVFSISLGLSLGKIKQAHPFIQWTRIFNESIISLLYNL